SVTPAVSGTLHRLMSDQPYVQGLCTQLNTTCWPLPRNATELLRIHDTEMVLVIRVTNLHDFNTQWLHGLMSAINANHIQQLDIYLDELMLKVNGGRLQHLRRWLTRKRDIKELLH